MNIEYVEDDHINDNITAIKEQIDNCIMSFCNEHNIDNINDISQSVYNAMLMYINNAIFKYSNRLKRKPDINNKLLNGGLANNNAYDTDLCFKVCEYYVYLCRLYDKECSIVGFEYLTGIDYSTVYKWLDDKASSTGFKIGKRLQSERERSLSDKLLTGKNPVGVLGILNHFYGWSGVGNMREDTTKQALSLADVRKQAALLSDNSNGSPPQIAENSG